jgi:glycosyltransferase involved in cell wall biosynthesis
MGSGHKILEAMASGCAIVATRKSVTGIEVRDGTSVVLADEPSAFANAIVRVLREPLFRKSIGCGARKIAETLYSPEKRAEDLERILVMAQSDFARV